MCMKSTNWTVSTYFDVCTLHIEEKRKIFITCTSGENDNQFSFISFTFSQTILMISNYCYRWDLTNGTWTPKENHCRISGGYGLSHSTLQSTTLTVWHQFKEVIK